jgi:hypothetical protein
MDLVSLGIPYKKVGKKLFGGINDPLVGELFLLVLFYQYISPFLLSIVLLSHSQWNIISISSDFKKKIN